MTDHDLEDRLSAMLKRRAEDINATPAIDFSSAGKGRTRLSYGPYAVAAAVAVVVLAAGGTVVGIRSIHHPSPTASAASKVIGATSTPSARPTTCRQVKQRLTWQSPIANGTKVSLDHPDNSVVSVNGTTGEYLLLQTIPSTGQSAAVYDQATLAIFHGATGQDVAVLPTGSTDLPVVDPAGAITPDWIAFGFAPPQNGGTYYRVMLYNRHTHATTTVARLSESALQSGQIFSAPPVIFGGKLYWISSIYSDRSKSMLQSYDLQTGARTSTPVPGAESLFYYGIGVATISGQGAHSTFTTKLGTPLPGQISAYLNGATAISYSAPAAGQAGSGELQWVKTIIDRGKATTAWYLNEVGSQGAGYTETNDYSFNLAVGTNPFVPVSAVTGSGDGVMEGRQPLTGVHSLPDGDVLQATVGDTAIFGTGTTKLGSTGLVLVKISSLPRELAGC